MTVKKVRQTKSKAKEKLPPETLDAYTEKRFKRWKRVTALREEMNSLTFSSRAALDKPALLVSPGYALNLGWEVAMREIGTEPEAIRALATADQLWSGMEPVHLMFDLIGKGVYPPPELLMACAEFFHDYLMSSFAAEDSTLENTLLGRPVPKAGRYAERFAKMRLVNLATQQVHFARRKGLTQAAAVEKVWGDFFPANGTVSAALKAIDRHDLHPEGRRYLVSRLRAMRRGE